MFVFNDLWRTSMYLCWWMPHLIYRNTWVPVFTGHSILFSLKKNYCLHLPSIWYPEANKNIHCNPLIVYKSYMNLLDWLRIWFHHVESLKQATLVWFLLSFVLKKFSDYIFAYQNKVLFDGRGFVFWYVISIYFHWLEWIQTIHFYLK